MINLKNKGKSARRNIYVCDQGHYGSTTCSLCGGDVRDNFFECPHCGAKFDQKTDIDYNRGGSDF